MSGWFSPRKIFCCDCGDEVFGLANGQKRCRPCGEAAQKVWQKKAAKKWRKTSRAVGGRCTRCDVRVEGRGMCSSCKEYVANWKKNNRERVATHKAKRNGVGGAISSGLSARLLKAQRGKCVYCRDDIRAGFHLDHIQPIALGGRNEDSNIQLLCRGCNLKKGAKPPEVFAQRLGFLL